MTIGGTVNKTALGLVILLVGGGLDLEPRRRRPARRRLTMVGVIGGFVIALVTVFKRTGRRTRRRSTPRSRAWRSAGSRLCSRRRYPGIVSQAVFLTFGTLGALLLAYRSGLIQATENFKLGVFAATGGIVLVYLVGFVMSFFGASIPLIHASGTRRHRLQPGRGRRRGAEPGARLRLHRAGRRAAARRSTWSGTAPSACWSRWCGCTSRCCACSPSCKTAANRAGC